MINVLRSKHHAVWEPPRIGEAEGTFEPYASYPEPVPLDCDPEAIKKVTAKLSSSARLIGTDALTFRKWLLRFGLASRKLRQEFALWLEWMIICHPLWAVIHAILAGHLTGYDKKTDTYPLNINEAFRCLMVNTVVHLEDPKALEACEISNVAAGISSGIEELIHTLRESWDVAYLETAPPPALVLPPAALAIAVAPQAVRVFQWGPRPPAPLPSIAPFRPTCSATQRRRKHYSKVCNGVSGGSTKSIIAAIVWQIITEESEPH